MPPRENNREPGVKAQLPEGWNRPREDMKNGDFTFLHCNATNAPHGHLYTGIPKSQNWPLSVSPSYLLSGHMVLPIKSYSKQTVSELRILEAIQCQG